MNKKDLKGLTQPALQTLLENNEKQLKYAIVHHWHTKQLHNNHERILEALKCARQNKHC